MAMDRGAPDDLQCALLSMDDIYAIDVVGCSEPGASVAIFKAPICQCVYDVNLQADYPDAVTRCQIEDARMPVADSYDRLKQFHHGHDRVWMADIAKKTGNLEQRWLTLLFLSDLSIYKQLLQQTTQLFQIGFHTNVVVLWCSFVLCHALPQC